MSKLKDLLNPVRDYTPISSAGSLEEFINSTIHKDFINELIIRIEQMRDLNEECDSKMYLETRGGIKALRLVGGIFEDLLNNALTPKTDIQREEI